MPWVDEPAVRGAVEERVLYIVSVKEPVPFLEAIMPLEPKGPFPSFE